MNNKIIADLHLHSKYSRAVSQEMIIPKMAEWAVRKGIDLLGTGDFTHPLWLREIKSNLEPLGNGLFALKTPISHTPQSPPLFLLTAEVSSIYSQGGKLRRIHNLILAPSIETVEKINDELSKRGAPLFSDGRPMTGIPCPDLVKLVLSADENALIIPCHVWTPYFSLYGSESGFDSIKECFSEMAKNIYAIETGLSSDPAMNWRIKELENLSIVSFSDAHSGPKLGREATVFELEEVSYENIRKAIIRSSDINHQTSDANQSVDRLTSKPQINNQQSTTNNRISYTIEFYPEEGKYHYTGHRFCNVRQSPEETKRLGESCPVCGKHLTVGVIHRVEELSQKISNFKFQISNGVRWIYHSDGSRPPYVMLVPLSEILAESFGSLPTSQSVINEYNNLTDNLGGEFKVLLEIPIEEISKISRPKVSEGIERVRKGEIVVEPGYDGVFGEVKIWPNKEEKTEEEKKQLSLFS